MKVQELMVTAISTAPTTALLSDIAHLLTTQRLGAVPVVDERDCVLGIVTEQDLFPKRTRFPYTSCTEPALFDKWVRLEQLPEVYAEARHLTAADVMTTNVVCVDVEDSIGDVARLMVERDLKRLPVLRNGKLAGIVTRAGILVLLARIDTLTRLRKNWSL